MFSRRSEDSPARDEPGIGGSSVRSVGWRGPLAGLVCVGLAVIAGMYPATALPVAAPVAAKPSPGGSAASASALPAAAASRAAASRAARSRAIASTAAALRSAHAAAARSAAAARTAAGAAVAAAGPCQQAPNPGVPIPPLAPRDPLITQLGLDQAWGLSTGAGVTVGVVDTGVDPASPKLAGAVDVGRTFQVVDTKAVFASTPGGRIDCDGHGTEVAGIIAGRTNAGDDRVSGVAPASRIYPVAIRGEIAQAPSALIAAAIRDAAAHARVINLSFARPVDSPDVRAAVAAAVRDDVVVVAASANETSAAVSGAAQKWYPAAYPGVLAVAASGADQGGASTGSWISVAAPGSSLTTVSRGGNGYVTVTGTSFATAVVSGAVALLRSRFPAMSAATVIASLEQTAVPPGDGARNNTVGFGVIDPYRALTAAARTNEPVSANPGAIAARPLPSRAAAPDESGVLGTTALLAAIAVLVGLGSVSVRSGRRRGWHAGGRPREVAETRRAEPHPADLG